MKRSWTGLLLLALVAPACQSSGPKPKPAPPAPLPEALRPYQGALRVLLRGGDAKALTLKPGQAPAGSCDVVVRIESLVFGGGTARFSLESVGLPRVGERPRQRCKRLEPELALTLSGLPEAATEDVLRRIDAVLLTPEAYLRVGGGSFDRPAGAAPSEVASQLPDANDAERRLARSVVAWPRRLLSVDVTYRGASSRSRHERLVGFEAVVGTDGRLYRPTVKVSIDRAQEAAILAALAFWRFEPAHRADGPVGARVPLEAVFRVY
jgi:hypothetical protein